MIPRVAREHSRSVNYPELVRKHPAHLASPLKMSKKEVRYIQLNQPELMFMNSAHSAIAVILWFVKIRGGALCMNYAELVHKHPAHLASPLHG